ncbi:flagellar biosynthesis protein FlhF [Clostridium sp.]|uniref:flagellar biosynthesis protein FlhF n=1 Tax=Clostridium sp. TaxID=1506 RepID=UPI003216BBAA
MIIKKYIASNMKEALNMVGRELGKDAIIISQRAIRKPGIKGIFSSKVVEITASVESKVTDSNTREEVKNFNLQENGMTNHDENSLKKEVEDMKNILNAYLNSQSDLSKNGSNQKEKVAESDYTDEIIEELCNLDISKDIAVNIVNSINSKVDKCLSRDELVDKIKEELKAIMRVDVEEISGTVALVGPTGVGKTTTIAKLAGNLALVKHKNVGLITVDTYRIGAVEQLKTYADIMNINFKVVFSINEMEEAIESMKDCDVILVDTTGRSSKNTMQVLELKAFIEKGNVDNTYLVVSATTKGKDMDIIAKGFSNITYRGLILTKLDETGSYGSIVNICNKTNAPMKFITLGQNVPDDIKIPTEDEMVKLVLGESGIC